MLQSSVVSLDQNTAIVGRDMLEKRVSGVVLIIGIKSVRKRKKLVAIYHNGILSCFFHGFSSCLVRSLRSPSAIRLRVECG